MKQAKEALEEQIKEGEKLIQLSEEALEEQKKFKKAVADIFFQS